MFTKEQLWAGNNIPRTNSLFVETSRKGDQPIMSLNGHNEEFPCLRDLYVAYVVDDPSEAVFAEVVFNDIAYWLKLKESAFMPSYLKQWNEIVNIKRKQKAFKVVLSEIENDGKSSFQAAKYIIEEQWNKDSRTKEAKKRTTKTSEKAIDFFKDDLDRLKDVGIVQ